MAIPSRDLRGILHRAIEAALVRDARRADRIRAEPLAGDVFRDQALLHGVERRTLQLHLAVGQRGEHRLGREVMQLRARGRLFVGAACRGRRHHVTDRTLRVEELLILGTLGGRTLWAAEPISKAARPVTAVRMEPPQYPGKGR